RRVRDEVRSAKNHPVGPCSRFRAATRFVEARKRRHRLSGVGVFRRGENAPYALAFQVIHLIVPQTPAESTGFFRPWRFVAVLVKRIGRRARKTSRNLFRLPPRSKSAVTL